jgi:hypothetical protein
MKKGLIGLIFLIIFGLIGFVGFKFYYKNSDQAGLLKASILPKTAVVTINNRVYKTTDGLLRAKLNPQEYSISFSYPGYSIVNKVITIKPKQEVDLGQIYLFPQLWPQDKLISNTNIINFYANSSDNLIVYLTPIKNNFDWYLYNRSTKDNQKFYQSSVLPQTVVFTPDSKKLLVSLKDNDWKVVFLPKSLINTDIDLDNAFFEALKKLNLETKPTPQIKQILVIPNSSKDDILIRTMKGVYRFNYLERSLTKIFDGFVSPLVIENDQIYFVKDNGILSSLNLTNLTENQLSFFSFKETNEDLNQIIIKKLLGQDTFVVMKPNGWVYLLNSENNPPVLLDNNTINSNFSLSGKEIILYQNNKGLIVYDLTQNIKTPLDILSDNLPQWFLDDNCFILANDTKLKIYNFITKEPWLITDELKNNAFLIDNTLNYIFFLSKEGIIKTGL